MINDLESIIHTHSLLICLQIYSKDGFFDDDNSYEFDSLKDFISFVNKHPEKMSFKYDYALLTEDFQIMFRVDNYNRFIKLLKNLDLNNLITSV